MHRVPISALAWNGLMRRQVACGAYRVALQTFSRMHRDGVQPDNFTFPIALKACTLSLSSSSSATALLRHGQQIHALLFLLGYQWDVYIANALVSVYCACGHLQSATQLFDAMPHRSTVTWNSIMAGCIRNGSPHIALSYFSRMLLLLSEEPDSITICTLLNAHAHLGSSALLSGRATHGHFIRQRSQIATITRKPFVENALIHMYLESSSLTSAEKVFEETPKENRDIVTWTNMISGYIRYRLQKLALSTFRSMLQQQENANLDPITLATVMPALTSLRHGKEIHCFAIKCGYDRSNVFVATSLLHMYAELGNIDCAVKQFERIEERNVVAWTAMITAYARHGRSEDSLGLFDEMRLHHAGVTPNHLTFMGVLTACNHAGLVDQAQDCFKCMTQEYGLTPDMYHYAAMVDVLGRAGRLREALKFIKAMPVDATAPVWGSLLASCDLHHELELGHEVAKIVVGMEPNNPGNFVLLSNMLAQDCKWDDASVVRETMKRRGLKKLPAHSSVHVGVHQPNY